MGESTPTTLAEFTPEWLTGQLRLNGTIDDATQVTTVEREILGTGEGFMGELARLTLTYDGTPGPATVIAKIPTQITPNRALGKTLGIYEREVRMYADLVPQLPVPIPEVYAAIYEAAGDEAQVAERTRQAEKLPVWLLRLLLRRQSKDASVPPCVLLLEDLADTAQVGDQVAGLPLPQIEAALRTLARFHAATWNKAGVPDEHWVMNRGDTAKLGQAFYLNGRKQTREVYDGVMSDRSLQLLWDVKKTGVERMRRMHTEVPVCLLHGDFRPDNLFFDDHGEVVSVIDWQATAIGPAAFEIFYFIVCSIEADDPDAEVDALLAAYHDELVASGVGDYSLDQLKADYIDAALIGIHGLPLLIGNLDFGDGRGAELARKGGERLDGLLARVSL